jgi:hypothetical protein
MVVAKRILRYIKGIMDYNIYFPPNNEIWVSFLCKCKLDEGLRQVRVNDMVDIQTTKLLNDME